MSGLDKNNIDFFDTSSPVRLNKFLSDAGFCSRREADRLIEDGKVFIDGQPAALGTRVEPGQEVSVNGKVLKRDNNIILIAYNKPEGIECTTDADNPDNIVAHINYPKRIYPIGRLDKNSTGLILLTNTGEIVNGILRSVNMHEKEYVVSVDKDIDEDFIQKMRNGIYLDELEVKTRPCEVCKNSAREFNIILTQGLNRQIRRMCAALGYKVVSLKRIRIMNIELDGLKEDEFREVSKQEFDTLLNLISQ